MKHILRITILVALFCAAAVQSWANFPNPTITKGYIYGGTVKIYAQDPTTNTSQSEITDAAAGNTVYLVAEADYQHTIAGIDWRVMKSGSSKYAMSAPALPTTLTTSKCCRTWRGTSTRSPCLRAARE